MILIRNIKQLLTLQGVAKKQGRHTDKADLGIIDDAFLLLDNGKIAAFGKTNEIPKNLKSIENDIDGRDLIIFPAITDCHTHTVFAGNRAIEYVQRLEGKSYEQIAKEGGGINFTATQTQQANDQVLTSLALTRLMRMYEFGINAVEIKSGYGLTLEHEERITNIIHQAKVVLQGKMAIYNTYMAAHAIPKPFQSSKDYMSGVVLPLLKKLAPQRILDAVDIFHEQGYFNSKDVTDLFKMAHSLNIAVKIHADEMNDNDGALLAVENNAISADHLMCISSDNIQKFAKSNTVAVMLPGTSFFLGKKTAPARQLLDAGARVALATDFNPGSCHYDNLIMLAAISAPTLKMTISEVIAAITFNSSQACARSNMGYIEVGNSSAISIFKCDSYEQIFYDWGHNYSVNKHYGLSHSAS